MTMTTNDLPREVRQQVLKQIRSQVGGDAYSRMLRQLGEDGLIDLAVRPVSHATDEAKRHRLKGWWDDMVTGALRLAKIIGLWLLVLSLFYMVFEWLPSHWEAGEGIQVAGGLGAMLLSAFSARFCIGDLYLLLLALVGFVWGSVLVLRGLFFFFCGPWI